MPRGFNKVLVILSTILVVNISMLIEIILNVGRDEKKGWNTKVKK